MPRSPYKIDGNVLRQVRTKKFLTRQELARMADVSEVTIAAHENCNPPRGITAKTLKKLARALGVTPQELLLDQDD